MRARLIVAATAPSFGQAGQDRLHLDLVLGQFQHQGLFGLHLIGQRAELVGQLAHVLIARDAAFLAAHQDALQAVEAFGGLFQQGLDIDRDRLVGAFAAA